MEKVCYNSPITPINEERGDGETVAKTQKTRKTRWGIAVSVLVVIAVAVWCTVNAVHADGVDSAFRLSASTALLTGMFVVASAGYWLGSISVKGVSLGTAGVFLAAVLFGYLCTLPGLKDLPVLNSFFIQDSAATLCTYYSKVVQNVGLVLFVTSIGFIAGPNFFKTLKKNAKVYLLLVAILVLTSVLMGVLFALIPGIEAEYAAGVLAGALSTTPGFSAALEAARNAGGSTDALTLGYAVAYPFGVVGVVLFVQLIPKWLKADMPKERELFQATVPSPRQEKTGLFACDPLGMAPFAFAVVLGLLLGLLRIPLTAEGYAGPCFSLGATGGTLLMSLLFGHFGHVGNLSLKVPTGTTKVLRELGLMLFLIGAGVSGGVSLVSEVGNAELGVMLVVYGVLVGAMITMLPLFLAFWVAKRVLKLNLLENLGSIAGGMTSTPALGTLIQTAGTDAIAAAYASTYPLALVFIVLSFQLMVTLMV